MTTITLVQLVAPSQLAAADTAVYTVPLLTSAKIGRAVFTNTAVGAVSITAGITTGGNLTAGTTLIDAMPLAPGQAYVSLELAGAVLPASSELHAYASATTSVTFTMSGLTIE